MPYFRDQVVAEFTSLYELLVRMYLPPDALKYPPPGGWPNITADRFGFMEKSESVIDLLKHIPYIRREKEFDPYQVSFRACCCDYSGKYYEKVAVAYKDPFWEPMDEEIAPPAHGVTLWHPQAPTSGYTVSINTKTGALSMEEVIVGRSFSFANIEEFCSSMKDDFRSLRCVPLTAFDVTYYDVRGTHEEIVPTIKNVYLECGWPSTAFRKEECAAKVAEIKAEADERLFGN